MLDQFNLLVSSARGNERDANYELSYLLREIGGRFVKTDYTSVSGLTVARTDLDPARVIKRLKPVLRERPWEFRYILKIKPVKKVVESNVDNITQAAADQASAITEGETFRVSVEKRQSRISSKEIIDAVAARIPRKVDLQNPRKVVLVEIIADVAGVSVIEPKQILGVEKLKRDI